MRARIGVRYSVAEMTTLVDGGSYDVTMKMKSCSRRSEDVEKHWYLNSSSYLNLNFIHEQGLWS